MPSRFEQTTKRFLVPNLIWNFGETVEYFAGGTGVSKTISAMVERSESAILQEIGEVVIDAVIVRVSNDSVKGIDSKKLDTGRDRIAVSLISGGEKQMKSIVRILSDANGFVRFLAQ